MKIIDILRESCPEQMTQVILMNGNGVWHTKRAGIASYFGVSKSIFMSDGITQERVEQLLVEQASAENPSVQVIGDSGAIIDLAYNRTTVVHRKIPFTSVL
jgi:deoxyinosine 3'endonuclease (endonuclease V)